MTAEALAHLAATDGFEVAFDDEGPAPEDPLLRVYGGPLGVRLDRPRLLANFVATADGVTAFGGGSGEGAMAISLHSPADRFVMAMLRCAADCVLIGAGTLRDDPHHQWTPGTPLPELGDELAAHRLRLTGTAEPPALAVVSGSGVLPAEHPALTGPQADVLVITSPEGAGRLPSMHPRVRVAVTGEGEGGGIPRPRHRRRGALGPGRLHPPLRGRSPALRAAALGWPRGRALPDDLPTARRPVRSGSPGPGWSREPPSPPATPPGSGSAR